VIPSHGLSFRRGKLLVILTNNLRTMHEWRAAILRQNYVVYDHRYPFRLAAEQILRQNKQYQQPSRFRHVPVDKFIDAIMQSTSRYFGADFDVDYFLDWVCNMSPEQHVDRNIAVFGIDDPHSDMLYRLRRMGAMVISPPNVGGDFIMHTVSDLNRFLIDLRL
jgi:hypothetical protein